MIGTNPEDDRCPLCPTGAVHLCDEDEIECPLVNPGQGQSRDMAATALLTAVGVVGLIALFLGLAWMAAPR